MRRARTRHPQWERALSPDTARDAAARLARAIVSTALFAASTALAQTLVPGYPDDVFQGDAREMAMIPPYCKYALIFRDNVPGGNDAARIRHWYDVMGPTFHHIHHYCAGLIKTNRAVLLANTGNHRRFYLRDSINEFDYVIRSAPPDFVLLPEILTHKGENLLRLGDVAIAVRTLERAIELNAGYWPPYASLSDAYKALGNPTKARAVLQKGLAVAPEALALKRRLRELDAPRAERAPARLTTSRSHD
jgi:tetratricopeptide (TPR) repeat protein